MFEFFGEATQRKIDRDKMNADKQGDEDDDDDDQNVDEDETLDIEQKFLTNFPYLKVFYTDNRRLIEKKGK